jgi:hypothetical protein
VNYKLIDKRVTAFLFGFAAVELEVNFCSLLQHLFERQIKQKLCTLFTNHYFSVHLNGDSIGKIHPLFKLCDFVEQMNS